MRTRRLRGWLRGGAGVLLVLAAVVVVGLRAGALRFAVLPAIEAAVGCDAEAARVDLTSDGTIYIEDLRLIARGVEPVAATFFEAPHVEIVPRWWAMISGGVPVERITVRRPTIVISQDQAMNLNIAGLGGKVRPGGRLDVIPGVELHDGTLSVAEHGQGWINPLISLTVDGRIVRPDPLGPRYTLDLTGLQPAGAGVKPIHVTGEYNIESQTGMLALENLDLSRFRDAPVPSAFAERWSRMNIGGNVRAARLTYSPSAGPAATFSVRDVNLNIPLPDEPEADRLRSRGLGPERPRGGQLAMRTVTGDVRLGRDEMSADLRGLIEDLACRVELTLKGSAADGELSARITTERFLVAERPRLLPFSPFIVKMNFKRFSGPTALVSGIVDIARGPATPEGPADLKIKGRIDFENGTAEFEKFPYPFSAMRGTILFDDEKVDIVSIVGQSASGARLLATGSVIPPHEDAEVRVDVTVVDVPTDDLLRQSVPERRRGLLNMLMSQEWASRLGPELLAQAAPGWTLGGLGTIKVVVHRAAGPKSPFTSEVDVRFPRAGLLSEAFPYPLIAHDLHLRIQEDGATLEVPRFEAPGGASGTLRADVGFAGPGVADRFEVQVGARGLVLGPLMHEAVVASERRRGAREMAEGGGESEGFGAERLMTLLGLSGTLDVEALVRSAPAAAGGAGGAAEESEEYDVRLGFWDLTSSLGEGCLAVSRVSGEVFLSNDQVEARGLRGLAGTSLFEADVLAQTGGGVRRVRAEVRAPSFDLAEPVEDLLKVVAPPEAETLSTIRARVRPSGRVDARLRLEARGEKVDYGLDMGLAQPLSVRVLGSVVGLTPERGSVRVTPAAVEVEDLAVALRVDGEDGGRLAASGVWPLRDGLPGAMDVDLSSIRLDAPLVRGLARGVSERLGVVMDREQVRGEVALRGSLGRGPEGTAVFHGVIEPRWLGFTREDASIEFRDVSGRVVISPEGGRVEELQARGSDWGFSVNGSWSGSSRIEADLRLGLHANGLPADLRGLLPASARRTLEESGLMVDGPVVAEDARLTYAGPADGDGGVVRLQSRARFDLATMRVGAPLTLEQGTLSIDAGLTLGEAAPPLSVRGELGAVRADIAGVTIEDALLRVRSGEEPGTYLVPRIEGRVYGGAVSGSGVVRARAAEGPGLQGPSATGTPRLQYDAELVAASVNFAALTGALAASAGVSSDLVPRAPVVRERGTLDASLSLAGVTGDPMSRRGRGDVRVRGGEVVSLPGAMPLLRLSNLQLPLGERLDHAHASFFVRGDLLTFERIEASSPSVTIAGKGSMGWPSTSLDLRFFTRGNMDVPVLSDLFRGLRDELFTARLGGTLAQPEFTLESFPATQRMLGTVFRSAPGKVEVRAGEEGER